MSAVAGFARSARLRGRTGADDRLPVEVVDTAREVDIEVAGRAGAAGFVGDVEVSAADPGLSGRSLPAARALFWAAIASFMDGRVGTAPVLFEKADFPVVDEAVTATCACGFAGCLTSMS